MSYLFDSSAIFQAIKHNAVEHLAGNHTVELARYELSNILWKECALHERITSNEMESLIDLVKRVLQTMSIIEINCNEKDILSLAKKLKITFYDASYAHCAKRFGMMLITEDLLLMERARSFVKTLKTRDILL